MDSENLVSSKDLNSTGFHSETDGNNVSTTDKHKTNCIGNEIEQPDMELLINGISSEPANVEQQPVVVTPEMLYKLSKKIAQLTKVMRYLSFKNAQLFPYNTSLYDFTPAKLYLFL